MFEVEENMWERVKSVIEGKKILGNIYTYIRDWNIRKENIIKGESYSKKWKYMDKIYVKERNNDSKKNSQILKHTDPLLEILLKMEKLIKYLRSSKFCFFNDFFSNCLLFLFLNPFENTFF